MNSGRFTTACAALVRKYGAGRLHEVLLPTGAPAEALVGQREEVLVHQGYVLRWSGTGYIETMRNLADFFHERSATLLLVTNEGAREREPHRTEVRHSRRTRLRCSPGTSSGVFGWFEAIRPTGAAG